MTVGNGIRNLSQFVAELPTVAAGDQEIPIDETDNHQAERQGCQNSPNQVRTMTGVGFRGPGAYLFPGFMQRLESCGDGVPPFPLDILDVSRT